MRRQSRRRFMNWKSMLRNKKIRDFFGTIKFCINLSWKTSPRYTALRILCNVLVSVTPIALAKITQGILDGFMAPNKAGLTFIIALVCLFFVLKIIQGVAGKLGASMESLHSELMQQRCSEILLEKAVDADLTMYDTPQYYDVFSETQRNMQALTTITWNMLETVGSMVSFIAAIMILGKAKIYYVVAMLIISIPAAVAEEKYVKSMYQNDIQQINNRRKQNYLFYIGTSRNYAQETRCYGLGDILKRKYAILFDAIFHSRKKILGKRAASNIILMTVSEMVMFILTVQIVYQVYSGIYTIGDYSVYTSMLVQLSGTISILVIRIMSIYENKMKADFIIQLSEIAESRIKSGNLDVQTIETIEFEDVCFTYPGASKRAVDHVNFVLKSMAKTALVGVNGAGKSTVIKLLLRLYDADCGRILVNGRDIKEYRISALRKQIGVYTQNSAVFDWGLGENISIHDVEYDEKKCKDALEKCGGEDILRKCEGNMAVYLGYAFSENGMELSTGQKQKVALARAFYSDNQSVYILDEPSSSLDPETEKKVFENIERMSTGKVVLFTSHRISAINMTDYVIVLEDGRIIEEGTKETLLEKRGKFYKLYSCQR